MGIEDRDWYKDAQRKRLEREYSDMEEPSLPSIFRRNKSTINNNDSSSTFKGVNLWNTIIMTIIYCLAIFGALHLVLIYAG